MEGYYGVRRKRNIDISRYQEQVTKSKTEREEEIELEEGYEEYEEEDYEVESEVEVPGIVNAYDRTRGEQEELLMLNGKLFVPKIQPKKQTFSDTHTRVTTYLEKNVHQIIKILQQQGQIESITKFVNDSIKDHLMSKYNDNTKQ
jgi:hypothetical protein